MGGQFSALTAVLLAALLTTAAAGPCYAETQAQPASTPEQERLVRQQRLLEAMQAERRGRAEARAQAGQESKEAAEKCERARQELTRRREAAYLYRKGEAGEREVFSEEERAAATAQAEAAVKKWCP
jgi:hypothetical protein